MKKITTIIALCLALTLALAACSNGGGSSSGSGSSSATDTLTGSAAEVVAQLYDKAGIDGSRMFEMDVTEDTAFNITGMTTAQIDELTTDINVSTAAIATDAHQVMVAKCKDAASATQVKQLVKDNFDSGRWICVFPDQSFVVESGSYVLLVSSSTDRADELKAAFSELAGDNVGTVETFFTRQ